MFLPIPSRIPRLSSFPLHHRSSLHLLVGNKRTLPVLYGFPSTLLLVSTHFLPRIVASTLVDVSRITLYICPESDASPMREVSSRRGLKGHPIFNRAFRRQLMSFYGVTFSGSPRPSIIGPNLAITVVLLFVGLFFRARFVVARLLVGHKLAHESVVSFPLGAPDSYSYGWFRNHKSSSDRFFPSTEFE